MVNDLKQNTKEENKALNFFWIVLIPGRQNWVQGMLQRGGAVTLGPSGGASLKVKAAGLKSKAP